MTSYVYLISNLITNKHYIGKTNNKSVRWSQHKSKSKRTSKDTYLYNSIRKYGAQNFTFEIIKVCDTEREAYEYERVLIELFSLRNKKYGYNIIEGGSGGSKGYKVKDSLKQFFRNKYAGSGSVRSKFSDDEIINILDEYSMNHISTYDLAKKYNCGKSTMIRIINGTSYSNILYDRSKFAEIGITNRLKNIPKGENSKSSKLSDDDVLKIRNMYKMGVYTYQQLADFFKVTKTNIYFILNNKTRKLKE